MLYPLDVELYLGQKSYDVTHRALVMGILNRTQDSFYDGGKYWDIDNFLSHAEKLILDGADILDVGGIRAGPDEEVGEQEEMDRVCSAVKALSDRWDTPISIDTWRASVAKEAFSNGAVLGNDISGFADINYLRVAKAARASVVACHMRLAPRYSDPNPLYDDLLLDVKNFLAERIQWAHEAGIEAGRIFIDVGLDFGKTYPMSSEIFFKMDYFQDLNCPMVLAASHKEFLGYLTGIKRQERGGVSMAAAALAIERGCRIIRVHDVSSGIAITEMMEKLSQLN